jgi:CRISPR-associated protein Cas6
MNLLEQRYVDLVFDAASPEIPSDHACLLFQALLGYLPWLEDEPGVGVHAIRGADTGKNTLCLGHRAKLWLRIPQHRLGDTKVLEGKSLRLGEGSLQLGPSSVRPLTPFATLNARMVVTGPADEGEFFARAKDELAAMGISCGMICGKRRQVVLGDAVLQGYALMLHGLKPEESLRLQREGLGLHRRYGCGIFLPHKSIKSVIEPLD